MPFQYMVYERYQVLVICMIIWKKTIETNCLFPDSLSDNTHDTKY